MKSVQAFFIKVALFFLNYAPLFTLAGVLLLMLVNRSVE